MIQNERFKLLNHQTDQNRRYQLYWMPAAQKAGCNHALEYAIQKANAPVGWQKSSMPTPTFGKSMN